MAGALKTKWCWGPLGKGNTAGLWNLLTDWQTHQEDQLLTDNVGSGDEGVFRIDPGKSMMFSNAQFDSSNYYDYVVEGYVDIQYFSQFA